MQTDGQTCKSRKQSCSGSWDQNSNVGLQKGVSQHACRIAVLILCLIAELCIESVIRGIPWWLHFPRTYQNYFCAACPYCQCHPKFCFISLFSRFNFLFHQVLSAVLGTTPCFLVLSYKHLLIRSKFLLMENASQLITSLKLSWNDASDSKSGISFFSTYSILACQEQFLF